MADRTRVYVSSTFSDLEAYRAKVNEALRKAGYELVAMEDYPAFDERPLDKCLDDVASCDIYVGILAWRYGYIHALLGEFAHVANDRELLAIELALRQGAHVLALREGPDQLAAQLLGRLLHCEEPLLRAFCERIAVQVRDLFRPWLRPLTASLRSPEALVGTLKDKTRVSALALLADGRLTSGSGDNTIKLWNLKTGAAEATLEGHSGWVSVLALLPDGRLASGSSDASLLLWMPSGPKPAVIAKFVADAAIVCIAVSADGKIFIAGDRAGRVHFLRLDP